MVSSRSAPRLARERCQVAACRLNTAPGSLPSAILSLYAHAYCHSNSPKTFKGTHNVNKTIVSLLQEWACRLLPRRTTTTPVPWAAAFGAALGPNDGYSVAVQALFLYFLERSWLDLRGNDFTLVLWAEQLSHLEIGGEQGAFRRFLQVSVYSWSPFGLSFCIFTTGFSDWISVVSPCSCNALADRIFPFCVRGLLFTLGAQTDGQVF